jgi:hypothetical protein
MSRKTFKVSELVDMVNGICKDSDPAYKDRRQGAMNVLEAILHETGNYRGFRYLSKDECKGQPGVNYAVVNGSSLPHPDYELRFKDTDNTRVQYG